MRLIADVMCDLRVRSEWFFEDSFGAIMRLRPEDLRKRLWSSSRVRTRSTMVASPGVVFPSLARNVQPEL